MTHRNSPLWNANPQLHSLSVLLFRTKLEMLLPCEGAALVKDAELLGSGFQFWRRGNGNPEMTRGKKGIGKNARERGRAIGRDALGAEARQAVWGCPLGPPQPRIPTKPINLEGAHLLAHFILVC